LKRRLFSFIPGKKVTDRFRGLRAAERGITRRVKHDLNGLSLHDARVTPQLQAGHHHSTLHEAVMLLNGEVEACAWKNNKRVETQLLSEWGDIAVFPPKQNHTLFVKKASRIIVIRYPANARAKDMGEREAVPLPGRLAELREKMLEKSGKPEELQRQIEQELERMKG